MRATHISSLHRCSDDCRSLGLTSPYAVWVGVLFGTMFKSLRNSVGRLRGIIFAKAHPQCAGGPSNASHSAMCSFDSSLWDPAHSSHQYPAGLLRAPQVVVCALVRLQDLETAMVRKMTRHGVHSHPEYPGHPPSSEQQGMLVTWVEPHSWSRQWYVVGVHLL